MGMMASRTSLALEPGSSSAVMLGKRPCEASTDGGSHPRLRAMLHQSVWYKSFAFSIRSLSPLSYMGLNLACIMQRFLHDCAIPDSGASPGVARESSCRRSPLSSPCVPAQPSGSEMGESSKESEYSDDADCHQLLKDFCKV